MLWLSLQNTMEHFSNIVFFNISEKIFEPILEKFLRGQKNEIVDLWAEEKSKFISFIVRFKIKWI